MTMMRVMMMVVVGRVIGMIMARGWIQQIIPIHNTLLFLLIMKPRHPEPQAESEPESQVRVVLLELVVEVQVV